MNTCEYCNAPGYKTNGECIVICESRAFTGKCNELNKPFKKEPYVAPVVPGRNDKCPCGSGKKYKHCHIDQSIIL